MLKVWQDVKKLLEKNKTTYYLNSTLCLDLNKENEKIFGIGLSQNGKGFVYGGHFQNRKNNSIFLPEEITDLVNDIYKNSK
jgi:hypothetical protein